MKRVVSILLFTLPLCLWAKEDGMAENAVPLVEQPTETSAESISEVPAETAENPAGTVELTETVENPAGAVELTEAEKLIQQELAEIEAENLETEDVAEADSLAGEGEDGTEGESGAESEEADAELAADMAAADSASADSAVKSLFLDMTASAMPSESRRISGPYGIRTYRMHRGVDLGLCHGEDRTIVAAFAGPTPFTCAISSGTMWTSPESPCPSKCDRTSSATRMTETSFVPVRRRIARSSALLRYDGPYFMSFSRGRSSIGRSRTMMVIYIAPASRRSDATSASGRPTTFENEPSMRGMNAAARPCTA